ARLPFTRQGSFTDPGADLWAASVDYGGGPQPLALEGKSYLLEHSYALPGVYTVVVRVVDDDLGVDEDSFTVTVPEYRVSLPAVFHAAVMQTAPHP
ncbi:MAG: PKD domain-containing protein, partial [Chloroflexi bacterium]|nr:PKD domain-containing protein [Chloroflexota bacterium]